MSDGWAIDVAGATRVPLADLFALGRGDFAPSLPGLPGDKGFTPRFAALSDDHGFHADTLTAALAGSETLPDDQEQHAAEIEAARAQGFEAGLEAGRAENFDAVEMVLSECRALVAGLEDARAIDKAALGPLIRNAVLGLVTQIVETHVVADPAFVNACVGRVLSTLKEAHEAARLFLHPDDLELIGEGAAQGYQNLTLLADADLGRGTVRLETGGGEVEDGVRPRIARLERALRDAGIAA